MDKEKLKGYLEKVKTGVQKISKKVWIIIAATVILLAVGIAVFVNTRPYATLITGATNEEVSTVLTWLDSQGITNYRMEGTGTVLVPEGQVYNLKARLLMEQYSGSTSPWGSYFERVSALSTQSDRENAWLVALMEEMRSTIRQFEGVQDATVTINLGEDRRYVLDSNNAVKATAAVFLTMNGGRQLTEQQANAIRNYVAHSVAGLDIDSISIGDSLGNQYNSFGTPGGNADSSALKLQLEQETSNAVRRQIIQVLAPVYGEKNLSVAVNCVVELADTVVDEYEVHLPEWAQDGETNGAGIIGRRVYTYRVLTDEEIAAGGLVGAGVNSDIYTYVEEEPGRDDMGGRIEGSGTQEFDNSKTQRHSVITSGQVVDCSVAVSINATTAGVVDTGNVRNHVARAAGIATVVTEDMTGEEYLSSKISIMVEPFYETDTVEEPVPSRMPPLWAIIALGVGLLLFVILLCIILVVRGKKKAKQEAEQRAIEELMAVALPQENGEGEGANVMELNTERSMELRQSIREFVDENMEVAALLIRSWLKEDEENA